MDKGLFAVWKITQRYKQILWTFSVLHANSDTNSKHCRSR